MAQISSAFREVLWLANGFHIERPLSPLIRSRTVFPTPFPHLRADHVRLKGCRAWDLSLRMSALFSSVIIVETTKNQGCHLSTSYSTSLPTLNLALPSHQNQDQNQGHGEPILPGPEPRLEQVRLTVRRLSVRQKTISWCQFRL